jgi:hypothetical protein
VSALLDVLFIASAVAAALMLFGYLLCGWRLLRDPARGRFFTALRNRGLEVPAGTDPELREALRRCERCADPQRCNSALCPNTAYFDNLLAR